MSTHPVTDSIFTDSSRSAFDYYGYEFRESTFGIIKRLNYFLDTSEYVRNKLGLDVGKLSVLDIGCGTGINVTIPLAMSGYDVTGIDINRASIDKAQKLSLNIPNASFKCTNLQDLELDKQYHIVISSEVMEHLDKPGEFLSAIYPRLHDSGILLITVPNGYGYFELESSIEKYIPGITSRLDSLIQPIVRGVSKYTSQTWRKRHLTERTREYCDVAISTLDAETIHCNKFSKNSIQKLVEEHDFKILEIRNCTFLAGNIINVLLRESDTLLHWNCRIADYLPNWICSGWFISAKKIIHDDLKN